jgi:hypothetical protein
VFTAVLWIRIQQSGESGSRIFDDQKFKKKWYLSLFDQELLAYPLAFIRDVQDTGEAFSPQKITFSPLKK